MEDNPDIAIDLEKTLRAQLFPNQKYVSSFVNTDKAPDSPTASKTQSDLGTAEASAAAKAGAPKGATAAKSEASKVDKEESASTGKKSMLEKATLAAEKTESLTAGSAAISAANKAKPGSAFDGDNELF